MHAVVLNNGDLYHMKVDMYEQSHVCASLLDDIANQNDNITEILNRYYAMPVTYSTVHIHPSITTKKEMIRHLAK